MANIVRYQPLNVRRGQQQPYPSLWDPISRLHQQMNELFDGNFSNGVLSIMVPRDENKLSAKRRRIEVKSDEAGDSGSGTSSSPRTLEDDSEQDG